MSEIYSPSSEHEVADFIKNCNSQEIPIEITGHNSKPIGILAAVWNALSGDYLGSIVATSIPVGFIAWACSGLAGKSDAMQKTVIGMTFGAIIASVAVMIGGVDLPVIGASDEAGVGLAALILVLVVASVKYEITSSTSYP